GCRTLIERVCERPPRSLRSCERIGAKGSAPLGVVHRSNNIPWGLTPCPQFVHSFFARVSPSRGGELPKAAGGRSPTISNCNWATRLHTSEEFLLLACRIVENQS